MLLLKKFLMKPSGGMRGSRTIGALSIKKNVGGDPIAGLTADKSQDASVYAQLPLSDVETS
jgi:hypothetical protein